MDELNAKKTIFITDEGVFCYKVMPFGLKNVGATYQHLVNGLFQDHIGKIVEVYINVIIIKSKRMEDYAYNIVTAFNILDKANMLIQKSEPSRLELGSSWGL